MLGVLGFGLVAALHPLRPLPGPQGRRSADRAESSRTRASSRWPHAHHLHHLRLPGGLDQSWVRLCVRPSRVFSSQASSAGCRSPPARPWRSPPRCPAARPATRARPRPRSRRPARDFSGTDVHRDKGFTCVDCHGGNPNETDKVKAKAPATGFKGKPTGEMVIAVCSRCHSDANADAEVRAEAARRPGRRVRHERARPAPRQGRHQGRHLHQLPRRARHAAGQRCQVARLRHERGGDVHQVPRGPGAHEGLHAARRLPAPHRPAREVREERPPRRDGQGERSLGARPATTATATTAPCRRASAPSPTCAAPATPCSRPSSRTSTHSQIFDRGCVECHSNHEIDKPIGCDARHRQGRALQHVPQRGRQRLQGGGLDARGDREAQGGDRQLGSAGRESGERRDADGRGDPGAPRGQQSPHARPHRDARLRSEGGGHRAPGRPRHHEQGG